LNKFHNKGTKGGKKKKDVIPKIPAPEIPKEAPLKV
jgi:hypothetical protein